MLMACRSGERSMDVSTRRRFRPGRGRFCAAALVVICSAAASHGATFERIDEKPHVESVTLSGFGGAGTGWTVNGLEIPANPFPSADVVRLTNSARDNEVRSLF